MYLDNDPDYVDDLDRELKIVIYKVESRKIDFLVGHIAINPFFFCQTSKGFLSGSKKKEMLAIARERVDIDPIGFHRRQSLHLLSVQDSSDQRTLYV